MVESSVVGIEWTVVESGEMEAERIDSADANLGIEGRRFECKNASGKGFNERVRCKAVRTWGGV